MRKSIKAVVCAVSAMVICAAPNVANYAGIADTTTAITAEAIGDVFESRSTSKLIGECRGLGYFYITPGDAGATISPNGLFRFKFQEDGNMVVYSYCKNKNKHGMWYMNSCTSGYRGAMCRLQPDGNLVMYHNGKAIWNTGTSDGSMARKVSWKRLYLSNLGNLILTIESGGVERIAWQSDLDDTATKKNGLRKGVSYNEKLKDPHDPIDDKDLYLISGRYEGFDGAYIDINVPCWNGNAKTIRNSVSFRKICDKYPKDPDTGKNKVEGTGHIEKLKEYKDGRLAGKVSFRVYWDDAYDPEIMDYCDYNFDIFWDKEGKFIQSTGPNETPAAIARKCKLVEPDKYSTP